MQQNEFIKTVCKYIYCNSFIKTTTIIYNIYFENTILLLDFNININVYTINFWFL
jgi:hypothetical protein